MINLLTDSFELPRGAIHGRSIELGGVPLNSGELCLQEFFGKVQVIDKQYEKLDNLLKKLQGAHEETRSVTLGPAMKAIKQRMEKDVAEVGRIAHFVKGKIDELDRDNLANRQKPRCGKGTSVDRSRGATTLALKKKLKDKMAEFQILRERIQQEYREVVERRVFTVTGTKPDEETIERLIETGDSEQIFLKAIQEQGRGQIMNTMCEIQERFDAARDLEKMLLDLHQVFADMAVLVDAQGDMLDNIETQVLSAVDHVQSGHATLVTTRKEQKNNRKWKCYAIILLVIVVIGVLVVFKPWEKETVKKVSREEILQEQSGSGCDRKKFGFDNNDCRIRPSSLNLLLRCSLTESVHSHMGWYILSQVPSKSAAIVSLFEENTIDCMIHKS